ncbi:glutathione S-transferase [Trichoderma gamsii]|uniref:Glutathione S-transferase n=1 Tax=Trichoderma gamsii TaxID=398673 RepID=A0A2P4ZFQ0_9HYPO|nr:glutathione S-transferase [Trichoderma gamsii]PON23126.1 glutathione S-transferase [Trichoderma gamsii]
MLLKNLLSDSRKWILGTNSISLGDIHTAFIPTYIANVPGSLPEAIFNSDQFPHVMLYLARYQDATQGTHGAATPTLSGKEAAQIIQQAGFLEHSSNLTADSTELSIRQPVKVWRTNNISSAIKHFNSGKLLGLSSQEVIISSFTPKGDELHLHFPRRNIRVIPQL